MRLLLFLAALLLAPPVLADAIEPPPEDCPRGSEGTSSHAGDWCEPTECDGPDDCELACQPEIGLCITREEVSCGGMAIEPCTTTREEAHGRCTTSADCEVGDCEIADRCVGGRVPDCDCSAGASVGALGAVALVLALLAPVARLRRSRRRIPGGRRTSDLL